LAVFSRAEKPRRPLEHKFNQRQSACEDRRHGGTEDETTMKRTILIAGIILAAAFANAQDTTTQQQPLGDYARAVRKDKKPATAKQFDNDNLPADNTLNIVGKADASSDAKTDDKTLAAADGVDANKTTDNKPPSVQPGESQADRQKTYDAWKDRLSDQKAKVDLLNRELDVEQREYQLRAAAMYADAGNRLRNSGNWDKEDADYKQKIEQKKKALDDAKKDLDDMQEDARKAGVPSSVRE
jgi:hypothetical protein